MARATGWKRTSVAGIRRWGNTDKFQVRVSTGVVKPRGGYVTRERTIKARNLTEARAAKRRLENDVAAGDETLKNTTAFARYSMTGWEARASPSRNGGALRVPKSYQNSARERL